jgi:hypothetical protein
MPSFQLKNQQNYFKDFCPSLRSKKIKACYITN